MATVLVTGENARNPRKAVFLDRDGTINHDPGYLNDAASVTLLDGVGQGLRDLREAGYLLVVISNQSGVGRGLIDPKNLPEIHDRMNELLRAWGTEIDSYELCIHHPEAGCDCRKPQPKLLLDAAEKMKIDLSRSFMVGDRVIDLHAGFSAGCRGTALVRTGEGKESEKQLRADRSLQAQLESGRIFVGDDLRAVARWILDSENATP